MQFVYAHPAVTSVTLGALAADHVVQNVATIAEKIPAAFWQDLKSQGLIPAQAPVPN